MLWRQVERVCNMQQNQEESYAITWTVTVKCYLAPHLATLRIFSFALHLTVLIFYASRIRALLSLCVNSTCHKLLLLVKQAHHTELPHSTQVTPKCLLTLSSKQLTSSQKYVKGSRLCLTYTVLLLQSCHFSKKSVSLHLISQLNI